MTRYMVYQCKRTKTQIDILMAFTELDAPSFFTHIEEPQLITRWWAPKVTSCNMREGGEFILEWPEEKKKFIAHITRRIGGKELGFQFHWENGFDKNEWDVLIKAEGASRDNGAFVTLTQTSFTPPWEVPGTHSLRLTNDPDLRDTYREYWIEVFEKLADYWHPFQR